LFGGAKYPVFTGKTAFFAILGRIFPKDTIRVSRVVLGSRKIASPSSSENAVFSRSISHRVFAGGVRIARQAAGIILGGVWIHSVADKQRNNNGTCRAEENDLENTNRH
jgi:hypothetical protein